MAIYKLTLTGVQRLTDGAFISPDIRNPDWRAYQDWLLAGNVPDPLTIDVRVALSTYDFFQRWTPAERNLLRRRVLQADAIGDTLGDAIDVAKTRGVIDVSLAVVKNLLNVTCVNQAILTAPRAAQILDLTQVSP